MSNLEGEPTLHVSQVSKRLHTAKPMLIRAANILQPPLELSEDGKIYERDIERIEEALRQIREK